MRTNHRAAARGLESARRAGVWLVMAAIALLAPACVWQPVDNDNDPPANINDNDPNTNENDNDAPPGSEEEPLPPEEKRFTIQSQCGQLIRTCTTSFPGPAIEIVPLEGQQITGTQEDGFVIEGVGGEGIQAIQLVGIDTTQGDVANFVNYQWSFGATDPNPCSLQPGTPFSAEENPLVHMEPGLHYIRLTVVNDTEIASVVTALCGPQEAALAADFLEIEIEIRP